MERIEKCGTCRFWDQWDNLEQHKITASEHWQRMLDFSSKESADEALISIGRDPDEMVLNIDCDGNCRRRAPQIASIVADDDDSDPCTGRWPFTNVGDWCGEWQPNKHPIPTTDEVLAAIRFGNDDVLVPVLGPCQRPKDVAIDKLNELVGQKLREICGDPS